MTFAFAKTVTNRFWNDQHGFEDFQDSASLHPSPLTPDPLPLLSRSLHRSHNAHVLFGFTDPFSSL